MAESEWQILFYTCDCEGDFMKLGGEIVIARYGEKNLGGKIFRGSGELFDVRLPGGQIIEKCWVESINHGVSARAITPDGKILRLEHKTFLRVCADEEMHGKMSELARRIGRAEIKAKKINALESRKSMLTAELAKLEVELAKLKNEEDVE